MVGLSFWAMSGFLSGMVGDYLLEERLSAERTRLETLAERLAPSLRARDVDALDAGMQDFAGETGSRLLLTDSGGKVQLDTVGIENGRLYPIPQVVSILTEGQGQTYAVRDTETGEELNMSRVLFMGRTGGSWESVCASAVVYDSAVQGVLVLLSPADTIMRSVYQLQDRVLLVFAAVAAAVMVFSFVETEAGDGEKPAFLLVEFRIKERKFAPCKVFRRPVFCFDRNAEQFGSRSRSVLCAAERG